MKYIQIFSNIISVAGWCAAYLFFLFKYRFAFNYEVDINDHYYLIFAVPLLLLMILLNLFIGPNSPSLQKILWLSVVFALSFLLLLSKFYSFGNEYFVVLAAVFFINSCLAIISDKKLIYVVLIIVTLMYFFELYIGLQQYFEVLAYETNTALLIKGTLENSGVFACYLVVHLPLLNLANMLLPRATGLNRILNCACIIVLFAAFVLTCFLIYQTQSRTAYIALFVTITSGLFFRYGSTLKDVVKRTSKIRLAAIVSVALVIISFAGYYLFAMKKMSAVGRVMKTEIALQHFADNFWLGTGIGRFTWYYPQWQAQYFKETSNPPKDYFLSAGESYILFNEWLQWFKTVGLLGTLITIIALFFFFKAKSETNKNVLVATKRMVIAIMACGLTSYPLHANALLLLFGLCFVIVFRFSSASSSVESKNALQKKVTSLSLHFGNTPIFFVRCIIGFAIVLLGITSYKGFVTFKAAMLWQQIRDSYTISVNKPEKYEALYECLRADGKFLTDYGTVLTQDITNADKTIAVLKKAKQYFISRPTIEAMAKAYQQAGNYPKAIEQWQWVSNFLPNKFAPRHELLKLYQTTRDPANLRLIANTILKMPVKIPSAEVSRIKREAEESIKSVQQ
jgi:tetratricopeptide (TPR) repeat protein